MANDRRIKAKSPRNWTAESAEAFAHKLAFDFIAQLERLIEAKRTSKTKLAKKLGVSQSAISHVFNNPQNLTLKTIAKYSQALGAKAAIVSYDDGDLENENGLVNSQVFAACWINAGKPRDIWSIEDIRTATTQQIFVSISFTVYARQVASTYAEPSMIPPSGPYFQPQRQCQISSLSKIEVERHA